MRIVPFPDRGEMRAERLWLAELDVALGGGDGPDATSWRELRADVRALAPAIRPEFEQELYARIAGEHDRGARVSSSGRRAGARGWLAAHRHQAVAVTSALAALIAAAAIEIPGGSGPAGVPGRATPHEATQSAVVGSAPAKVQAEPAPSVAAGASSSSSSSSLTRLQQRAAAVTLGASPAEVQSVADDVARLTTSMGGFVQSSHVQVRQEGSGGAELTLSIPSAKLDSALAALGRIAPLRAESQSTQDITSSYESANRRLADLEAERQALLRALSGASTQGQIDSLRERLSGVSSAIGQAHSEAQSVARQAASSEVEVTVEGNSRAASEGFTLHRGLHDAGHVLVVALDVLLIGAAVLLPLALALAFVLGLARVLRRHRRERILDRS